MKYHTRLLSDFFSRFWSIYFLFVPTVSINTTIISTFRTFVVVWSRYPRNFWNFWVLRLCTTGKDYFCCRYIYIYTSQYILKRIQRCLFVAVTNDNAVINSVYQAVGIFRLLRSILNRFSKFWLPKISIFVYVCWMIREILSFLQTKKHVDFCISFISCYWKWKRNLVKRHEISCFWSLLNLYLNLWLSVDKYTNPWNAQPGRRPYSPPPLVIAPEYLRYS